MTKYKAVLFSSDGKDWVTDYRDCSSVDEVWSRLEGRGSRWFFYPFPAVIVDHGALTTENQRIVDACDGLDWLKGHTIRVAKRDIASDPEYVEMLLS